MRKKPIPFTEEEYAVLNIVRKEVPMIDVKVFIKNMRKTRSARARQDFLRKYQGKTVDELILILDKGE